MTESVYEINVFNLALGHVGNPTITTGSDSPECQLYYPFVRDKLLTWAPWKFATTRQSLSRLAETPPDTEYAYQYAMPTSPYPLRILDIDTQLYRYSREVYIHPSTPTTQVAVILTNSSTVVVKYIARVSEALFPPLFTDTLALWLGLAITQRLSGKATLRTQIFTELKLQMERLIDIDGHQDSPPRALNDTYILGRGDGTYLPMEDIEEAL